MINVHCITFHAHQISQISYIFFTISSYIKLTRCMECELKKDGISFRSMSSISSMRSVFESWCGYIHWEHPGQVLPCSLHFSTCIRTNQVFLSQINWSRSTFVEIWAMNGQNYDEQFVWLGPSLRFDMLFLLCVAHRIWLIALYRILIALWPLAIEKFYTIAEFHALLCLYAICKLQTIFSSIRLFVRYNGLAAAQFHVAPVFVFDDLTTKQYGKKCKT